jgi:hypothetical protein
LRVAPALCVRLGVRRVVRVLRRVAMLMSSVARRWRTVTADEPGQGPAAHRTPHRAR